MRISRLFTLLILLLLSMTAFAEHSAKDRYQLIQVTLDKTHNIQKLSTLGFDLEGSWQKEKHLLNFVAREDQLSKLTADHFDFKVLVDDLEAYYANRLKEAPRSVPPEGFGYGSMSGYYTYDEMVAQLDSLHAIYPDIVSEKDSIGTTHENHILWAVKISNHPSIDEDEPEVLYTGLHHAREPVGMMSVLYYMWWLADHYQTNQEAQYLVNNREMWFIPCVNPDGYIYNQQRYPSGGGMWRKNLRDNDFDHIITEEDGVDLNRNYGNHWGYDNSGSSPYGGDPTYRGPQPFSEPETQAIRDFVDAHHFIVALNYHTFSDLMIFPYSYAVGMFPAEPDYSAFREYAIEMTNRNGYHWGNGEQTVGYLSNGDSDDWMYAGENHSDVFAFTSEVGGYTDGFWPPQNRLYPLVRETLYQNKYLALIAGAAPTVRNMILQGSSEYPQPGETVEVKVPVENLGLQETSSQCVIRLTPLNNGISLSRTNFSLNNFRAHAIDTLQTSGQISLGITNGAAISLGVQVNDDGIILLDTVQTYIGTPLFSDNAEHGMAKWVSDDWGTFHDSYNNSYSFTDSPDGYYQSDHLQEMTLKRPLDFSQVTTANLTFFMRCLVEHDYDFSQVLVSSDSLNWTPVRGEFTRSGSGYGVQTEGEPGYDGDRGWLKEHVDLSEFAGNDSIYLRFQTNTDPTVSNNGWQVDDIQLYATTRYTTSHAEIDTTPIDLEVPFRSWDEGHFVIQNTGNNPLHYSIVEQSSPTVKAQTTQIPQNDLMRHIGDVLRRPANLRMIRSMGELAVSAENNTVQPDAEVVITDSLGDYFQGQSGFVYPDIKSVAVQYDNGPILYRNKIAVKFREAISDTIAGVISLDADQNFATGEYPAALGFLPPTVSVGAEYEVIALPFGLSLSDTLPTIPPGFGVIVDMSDSSIIDPTQVPVFATINPFDHSELDISFNPNSSALNIDGTRFNLAAAFIGGSIADSTLAGVPDIAPDLGHGTWGEEVGASWLSVAPMEGTIASNSSEMIRLPVVASVPQGSYQAILDIQTNSSGQTEFHVPVNLTVQPELLPEITLGRTEVQDTVVVGLPKSIMLQISNSGAGPLGFFASDTTRRPWLDVSPFVGVLQPGETQEIQLTFRTGDLTDGTSLNGHLFIASNDPTNSPVTVPIHIEVGYSTIADRGDLNRDGIINHSDVEQLTQLVLSPNDVSQFQFWAGDYNRDGVLDIRDVIAILTSLQ